MSSTPGEMCTVELESMTVMNFPRTSPTPGEMCAVELESRTVLGFPRNDSTPGESCEVELDFPRVTFPPEVEGEPNSVEVERQRIPKSSERVISPTAEVENCRARNQPRSLCVNTGMQ